MNRWKSGKSFFVPILLVLGAAAVFVSAVDARSNSRRLPVPGFRTNTAKRLIDFSELRSGGPGKDGIPSIDRPAFVKPALAASWMKPDEPVISLVINGHARAYPLQILTWHEIVNDKVADTPVAVTFCPLCYSAIVFHRTIDAKTYTFGVSGMLRHSDMVMYDRQTETLWQQFTGRAIVGDMVGKNLKRIAVQIISFAQFRTAHKAGLVLSRKTGIDRPYGRNPYVGYDSVKRRLGKSPRENDSRPAPMEKLIAVTVKKHDKAYPYRITRKLRVINDTLSDTPLVVFHVEGAVSALDKAVIADSREVGSTGLFDRRLDDKLLEFTFKNGQIQDLTTASSWEITGTATQGPLKGKSLTPIPHGDYFAFAWLAFKPNTKIYTHD